MRTWTQAFCLILAIFATSIETGNQLYAQGKLSRVRGAVRKDKPTTPPKKENRPKEDRDDRYHDDHGHQDRRRGNHRHRSRRRRSGCDVGLGLFVDTFVSPSPNEVHVIHHASPIVAPAPIIVPSQAVEPVYQPVVAPVPESLPEPIPDYRIQQGWMQPWGVRLSAFGGTDFDDIAQGSFALLLQSPNGLGA